MSCRHQFQYAAGLLIIANLLPSCSNHDVPEASDLSRSVRFSVEASASAGTSPTNPTGDLNALIFRHIQSSPDEVKNVEVTTKWSEPTVGTYQMQCQLETGTYNFSFSKGLQIVDSPGLGNEGNQCYWVKDTNVHSSIMDYEICHPKNGDGTLKECKTELYLNTTDVLTPEVLESNQKVKQQVLYHAQARLDMIFAYKGESTDTSPFARISTIDLKLTGLNSSCRLDGTTATESGIAVFTQTQDEEDFSQFDLQSYKNEFKSSITDDRLTGDNQKKIRKWLFFPSKTVNGTLIVHYRNGHSENVNLGSITLQSNFATMIVINVSKEHLYLSPNGIGSGELGDAGESGSGYWN